MFTVDQLKILAARGVDGRLPPFPDPSVITLGCHRPLEEIHVAHMAAVVLKSSSYCEAAQKLGVEESTLWRQRVRHAALRDAKPESSVRHFGAIGSDLTIDEITEMHLRELLPTVKNWCEAARVLGIQRSTLLAYRKRWKLKIE